MARGPLVGISPSYFYFGGKIYYIQSNEIHRIINEIKCIFSKVIFLLVKI